jgi:hypothetical protein
MSAAAPHHVLRRALIGGYRVADVEVALAELRLTAARLESELHAATRAREAAEVAADDVRRELGIAQRAVGEAQAETTALRRTVDEIADSARRSVAAAQEEAQSLRRQLGERLVALARELDAGTGATLPAPAAPAPPPPELVGPELELDAGPFDALADVMTFEQALRDLPDVTDVYLRQFEDRRVRVEVSVSKPVRLVEDIVARLPFSIDVTPDDAGRAVLTLDPAVGE